MTRVAAEARARSTAQWITDHAGPPPTKYYTAFQWGSQAQTPTNPDGGYRLILSVAVDMHVGPTPAQYTNYPCTIYKLPPHKIQMTHV